MTNNSKIDEDELDRILNDGTSDANFADKFVGDEAVRQICQALTSNCSKTRVFLDRNCVGADGAAALGDMLKVCKISFNILTPKRHSSGGCYSTVP